MPQPGASPCRPPFISSASAMVWRSFLPQSPSPVTPAPPTASCCSGTLPPTTNLPCNGLRPSVHLPGTPSRACSLLPQAPSLLPITAHKPADSGPPDFIACNNGPRHEFLL